MLTPTTNVYVLGKLVSDCISVIRDVNQVSHEFRRSESKKLRLIRVEKKYK